MTRTRAELDSLAAAGALDQYVEHPDRCEGASEPNLDTDYPSTPQISKILGRQIRLHRFLRGWGPSELARRARISRTALFRIERGSTFLPRAATLQRIAQALQVTVDELLSRSGDPASTGPASAPSLPPAFRESGPDACSECVGGQEVERKFLDLLESPMGDWVVHLIEGTHRWLSTVDPGFLRMAQRSRSSEPLPDADRPPPESV